MMKIVDTLWIQDAGIWFDENACTEKNVCLGPFYCITVVDLRTN